MTATTAPFRIAPFDPATASAEDWARYHAYRRLRQAELRPDDPLLPDAVEERLMKHDDPFEVVKRFGVHEGGRLVGFLYVDWWRENAPGYEENAKYIWAFGEVLGPSRRQGIGTAMARAVLDLMLAADKSVLTTRGEEEDGYGFLRWLDAEQVSAGAENRLDLQAVDWDMVARWVREGVERNPGERLAFYEHRIPDEALVTFCPMFQALLNTMPFDDMDHGEIVVTPDMMREQYAYFGHMDASHHAYVMYGTDGSIAGMTDVMVIPSQPDRVHQRFTGVRPDCRGRGLGKWLKAAMLQYLRRAYPDARWVITGNASSNDPMLAINGQLGFKAYRSGRTFQLGRAALAEHLAGL